MTSIRGAIRIGEAQATVAATAKRQRGGAGLYFAMMFALWIGGGVAGWAIGRALHGDLIIAICIGAVAGLLCHRPLAKRLVIARFRRRLTGTGTPLDMPATMTITPDALICTVADIEKRANWRAVSEVFYAKGYWIFMVQSEPWFAPDHFFASDDEKRVFLSEALVQMGAEARGRSAAAVKFVETSV
jgi:hypothetical protein